MSTLGRPRDGVGVFAFNVLDDGEITSFGIDGVEIDVVLDDDTGESLTVVGIVGRDNSESGSTGLPGKGGDVILVFDDFDGDILLTHSEDFQVAECCLLGSSFSRVSVDLDTEVVSLVLPVEFALFNQR
jgi:hypothetical protein